MEGDITRLSQRLSEVEKLYITLGTTITQHEEKMKALERILKELDGFSDFKKTMWNHVNEGEKPGGIRDKVKDMEHAHALCSKVTNDKIDRVSASMWKVAIVSGFVVGLTFKGVPELMNLFIKLF